MYSDIYTVLMMLYLRDLAAQTTETSSESYDFPPMPYLIYKTPLKFDRIKNQCGLFVYQGFFDYNFDIHTEKYRKISVQNIIPDITIEVKNQDKILKELDLVGINKKYVYEDFDNTAQYTNEKYFRP